MSSASMGILRRRGEVAQAVGISEAILYQRFGSKDALFFAAMHAQGPEIEELLGPEEPSGDAREYLGEVLLRLGAYFAEVIPLALRVMMHPSFDPVSLSRTTPGGPDDLREGLAKRIASLTARGRLRGADPVVVARLLLSLRMTGGWESRSPTDQVRTIAGWRISSAWSGRAWSRPRASKPSDNPIINSRVHGPRRFQGPLQGPADHRLGCREGGGVRRIDRP